MQHFKKVVIVSLVSLFLFMTNSHAETIRVGSQAAQPSDTVTANITLDIPANVQGAAFTVNYNSTYLTLNTGNVASPFFKTFTEQWAAMSTPPPPASVNVAGVVYTSPFVINTVSNGVMLAAAKVEAGGSETILFSLEFTLAANIPDGLYPISISTSFIKNATAGYPEEGIGIPPLFPVGETKAVSGHISVNFDMIDEDGDGIADSWEITHFGNLTTASEFTDWDKDGYTDLQEFLNGGAFNPKIKNESGDVGYIAVKTNSNFWIMMIPALIKNSVE